MHADQKVIFFPNGGARVLELPEHLNPVSERLPDWLHLMTRQRHGEQISAVLTKSTADQVVSKQQMQWTPEGAHVLRQARTSVTATWEAASYPRLFCALVAIV